VWCFTCEFDRAADDADSRHSGQLDRRRVESLGNERTSNERRAIAAHRHCVCTYDDTRTRNYNVRQAVKGRCTGRVHGRPYTLHVNTAREHGCHFGHPSCKSQIPLHYSWFGTDLEPKSIMLSDSNQLRTRSEPVSVIEFGREPASSC